MVEANKCRILFTLKIVFLQNISTYLHDFSHFHFHIEHLVGFYYKNKNHFHLFHQVDLTAFLPTTFADTSLHYHIRLGCKQVKQHISSGLDSPGLGHPTVKGSVIQL